MLNKSVQTIVICYYGTQLVDSDVKAISEYIKKYATKNTTIDIKVIDSNELTKLVAQNVYTGFNHVNDDNPVESACILIGTSYFSILSKNNLFMQDIIFGYQLSADAQAAVNNGNNKALLNAIKILSETDPPENLKTKYRITPKILDMIKKVASNI
ncbi:hypothetical protein [uncultured phage cr130_1]|uniref:Uncharacterized protein n=1 Tax=uncultured phage cr130_1 TaxID=2772092 RepID=A0A7M1RTC3_9CAUD|nr:hypothetical protein KNV59_gp20 [uncultured phage cr130_1]QOR57685.1 hypothetical protein [uncultured phage cr130_1]